MNRDQLPYLLPWVKVNLLIPSTTCQIWPDEQWRVLKPELRRALEIRSQIRREGWWN